MRRLLIGSLAMMLCAAAAPQDQVNTPEDEALIAKELAGLTPGTPQSCIPQSRIEYRTRAIGKTILYRVNNHLVYRNDTLGGCDDRLNQRALISQNVGAGLCHGQIIRSVDLLANFDRGACALGDFVPYQAN